MAIIEIGSEKINEAALISTNYNSNSIVICKSTDKLMQVINCLDNCNIWYVSNGDWSMHDLLIEILKINNPAKLYITTYALREFAVRQIVLAIDKGWITNVDMLLDYRAQRRTPEVYQFAQHNFANIKLTNVHAKVCVIDTKDKIISITGSANWTKNPRIESGVITDCINVGEFNINWIKNIMKDATIFE